MTPCRLFGNVYPPVEIRVSPCWCLVSRVCLCCLYVAHPDGLVVPPLVAWTYRRPTSRSRFTHRCSVETRCSRHFRWGAIVWACPTSQRKGTNSCELQFYLQYFTYFQDTRYHGVEYQFLCSGENRHWKRTPRVEAVRALKVNAYVFQLSNSVFLSWVVLGLGCYIELSYLIV